MKIGILCRDIGLPCPLWRKAGTVYDLVEGQAHVPTFSFMVVKRSFMTADVTHCHDFMPLLSELDSERKIQFYKHFTPSGVNMLLQPRLCRGRNVYRNGEYK